MGDTNIKTDPRDEFDPILLNIDDYQIEDPKERGLRTGLRVVAGFDGIAMVVIVIAILVYLRNEDNWIFLLNSPHICWWLFTIFIVGSSPSRVWFNVYIGFTAVWLVFDSITLIWRAVLLHNCYQKSSGNSCRDFEIQSWFIIIANAVLIITDIILIVLSVLLKRYVVADRERAAKEEEECRKLRERAHLKPEALPEQACKQPCPLAPTMGTTTALLNSRESSFAQSTTADVSQVEVKF